MASYELEMAYSQIDELKEDVRYLRAQGDSLRHLLDMADEANEDLKLELESAYACIDDLNARLDNINIKG